MAKIPNSGLPATVPGKLPDGRAAQLTGHPLAWPATAPGGPPTIACLTLLLGAFGRPVPPNVGSLSMLELRGRVAAAGLLAQLEWGESLEDLAHHIELGRVVVAMVNAGIAWDDAAAVGDGQPNHPLLVSTIARDPETADLLGVLVRDLARPHASFMPIERLLEAWLVPGGIMLAVGFP